MIDKDSTDGLQVLRGGAFNLDRVNVRCAARGRYYPYFGLYYFGFRVVLSPSSLISEDVKS